MYDTIYSDIKDAQRSFRSYPVLTGLWKFFGKVTRLRTQNFVAQQTWLKTEKWQDFVPIQ